jgi:predicted secreted protein
MILKGTDLMVFVKIASTYKSIGYATNHTLSLGSNATEVSTKDSGGGKWVEQSVQKLNWSMSTENLYSYDQAGGGFNDLFALMVSKSKVDLVFALEEDFATKPDTVPSGGWTAIDAPRYTGSAFITDIQVNAPDGQDASFTATFTGTGALTLTLPDPE